MGDVSANWKFVKHLVHDFDRYVAVKNIGDDGLAVIAALD